MVHLLNMHLLLPLLSHLVRILGVKPRNRRSMNRNLILNPDHLLLRAILPIK